VLEAAGVNISLTPEQVAQCVDQLNIGFMFAPVFHSAMKYAIGPRREMGVRTIFNLLGPLTNPAGAPNQVLGVYDLDWVKPLAEVLQRLGSHHVMVVHSDDGMDEISCCAPTQVAELRDDKIISYTIDPASFGISGQKMSDLQVESAEQSLQMIQSVLANTPGAPRDIVRLNAGAAIYVAGLAQSYEAGVAQATETIASGKVAEKLAALVTLSQSFKDA